MSIKLDGVTVPKPENPYRDRCPICCLPVQPGQKYTAAKAKGKGWNYAHLACLFPKEANT